MPVSGSKNFVRPWLPKSAVPRYLFTGAKVIDVIGGYVQANSSVLLENGYITAVTHGGGRLQVSEEVE